MTYTTNVNITADIHLDGISLTVYQQIVDYIASLTGGTEEPEEPKTEDHRNSKVFEVKPTEKWTNVPVQNRELYGKLIAILKDADDHPERYDRDWMNASTWQKHYEGLSGLKAICIARPLTEMAKRGWVERKLHEDPHSRLMKPIFYLPVKKPEGHLLYEARVKAGLSPKELSERIGYDSKVILGWEHGQFVMSSEAKTEINKALGRVFS